VHAGWFTSWHFAHVGVLEAGHWVQWKMQLKGIDCGGGAPGWHVVVTAGMCRVLPFAFGVGKRVVGDCWLV
jgi:hypothetical protein